MIGFKLGRHLSGLAEIRNRVEQGGWHGIYPDNAPQNAPYPRVIISVIGGAPDYKLTGEISDLGKVVQVDVDSERRFDTNEITELIRTQIGFITTPTTWDDVTVHSVVIENERDQTFAPAEGSSQWIYRRSLDYRIKYER